MSESLSWVTSDEENTVGEGESGSTLTAGDFALRYGLWAGIIEEMQIRP